MWMRCGKCQHSWAPASLPIEVRQFLRLMKGIRCPSCGAGGRDMFFGPGAAPGAHPGLRDHT
jgi:rubredoxin